MRWCLTLTGPDGRAVAHACTRRGPAAGDPVIRGAASLRERAKLKLAFGAATWPHQLVRIMLLEQLYRAASILAGHPYHRGGRP